MALYAVVLSVFVLGMFAGWSVAHAVFIRRGRRKAATAPTDDSRRHHQALLDAFRKVDRLTCRVYHVDAAVQSYLDFDCGEKRFVDRLLRFAPELCDLRIALGRGSVLTLPDAAQGSLLELSEAVPDPLSQVAVRDRTMWNMRLQTFMDRRAQCLLKLLELWRGESKSASEDPSAKGRPLDRAPS